MAKLVFFAVLATLVALSATEGDNILQLPSAAAGQQQCQLQLQQSSLDACRRVVDQQLATPRPFFLSPQALSTDWMQAQCCQQLLGISRECRAAAIRQIVSHYEHQAVAPLGGGWYYPGQHGGSYYPGETYPQGQGWDQQQGLVWYLPGQTSQQQQGQVWWYLPGQTSQQQQGQVWWYLPGQTSQQQQGQGGWYLPGQTSQQQQGQGVWHLPGQTSQQQQGQGVLGQTSQQQQGQGVPGQTSQQQQGQGVPGQTSQQQQGQGVPGQTSQQQQGQGVPGQTSQQQQGQGVPGQTSQQHQQGSTGWGSIWHSIVHHGQKPAAGHESFGEASQHQEHVQSCTSQTFPQQQQGEGSLGESTTKQQKGSQDPSSVRNNLFSHVLRPFQHKPDKTAPQQEGQGQYCGTQSQSQTGFGGSSSPSHFGTDQQAAHLQVVVRARQVAAQLPAICRLE